MEEPCFSLNPAGNCLHDLEQLIFFPRQGSMLLSKNGLKMFLENPFSFRILCVLNVMAAPQMGTGGF